MSPSSTTMLASGALNRSGDTLSIELHQPADSPRFVMVVAGETLRHRAHTESACSVGGCDGPHVGGGADGTRREDQEQPITGIERSCSPACQRADVPCAALFTTENGSDAYRAFCVRANWACTSVRARQTGSRESSIDYVVQADIAAFYQYVDHNVLLEELQMQTEEYPREPGRTTCRRAG